MISLDHGLCQMSASLLVSNKTPLRLTIANAKCDLDSQTTIELVLV